MRDKILRMISIDLHYVKVILNFFIVTSFIDVIANTVTRGYYSNILTSGLFCLVLICIRSFIMLFINREGNDDTKK